MTTKLSIQSPQPQHFEYSMTTQKPASSPNLNQEVNEKLAAVDMLKTDSKLAALDELRWAVVYLFFRFSATAQELHQQGEHSSGRSGLLHSLKQGGPATVPQLARARPVSRQFIQKLANEMAADGLVEFIPNPAHQRSKLLRITPQGECLLAEIVEREAKLGAWLAHDLDESDIRTAARVVSILRDKLAQSQERGAAIAQIEE